MTQINLDFHNPDSWPKSSVGLGGDFERAIRAGIATLKSLPDNQRQACLDAALYCGLATAGDDNSADLYIPALFLLARKGIPPDPEQPGDQEVSNQATKAVMAFLAFADAHLSDLYKKSLAADFGYPWGVVTSRAIAEGELRPSGRTLTTALSSASNDSPFAISPGSWSSASSTDLFNTSAESTQPAQPPGRLSLSDNSPGSILFAQPHQDKGSSSPPPGQTGETVAPLPNREPPRPAKGNAKIVTRIKKSTTTATTPSSPSTAPKDRPTQRLAVPDEVNPALSWRQQPPVTARPEVLPQKETRASPPVPFQPAAKPSAPTASSAWKSLLRPPPNGIGGLLYIFCLLLLLGAFIASGAAYQWAMESIPVVDALKRTVLFCAQTFVLGYIIYAFALAWAILSGSRMGRRHALCFLLLTMLLRLPFPDYILSNFLWPEDSATLHNTMVGVIEMPLVNGYLALFLWAAYFMLSRRANNNYSAKYLQPIREKPLSWLAKTPLIVLGLCIGVLLITAFCHSFSTALLSPVRPNPAADSIQESPIQSDETNNAPTDDARRAVPEEVGSEGIAVSTNNGDNKRDLVQRLVEAGDKSNDEGDITKAIKAYQQALSIFQELGDKQNQAIAQSKLGNLHFLETPV